jgi:hypothetical protein
MRLLFIFLFSVMAFAQDRVVLQTIVILDGKGGILKNQHIVIEGGRVFELGALIGLGFVVEASML